MALCSMTARTKPRWLTFSPSRSRLPSHLANLWRSSDAQPRASMSIIARNHHSVVGPAKFVRKSGQTRQPHDRAPSSAVSPQNSCFSVHDCRVTDCERPSCFQWLHSSQKRPIIENLLRANHASNSAADPFGRRHPAKREDLHNMYLPTRFSSEK